MSIVVAATRTRCEWYARGYNDHRPLSAPIVPPYIDPAKFADWYIANTKDVLAPLVGIQDAFTQFKALVEAGL